MIKIDHLYKFAECVCLLLLLIYALPDEGVAQDREDRVWNIDFEGNENYSSMVLKDIIATSNPSFLQKLLGRTGDYTLQEDDIRRDVIRISRYYERRGYDQIEVGYRIEERRKEWKKRVVFEISEGEPLRVSNARVFFEAPEEVESLIRDTREYERAEQGHHWQEGRRYQRIRESDVTALFTEAMEESGFPYAEVEFDITIDSLAREVAVDIINHPGPRKEFTSFEVTGEYTVDEQLIIRETGIDVGDTYSRSRMQTAQRELFNHHLFRFATVNIPDEPQDSSLVMNIRIREHAARSLQAMVGFGREELLRTQVSWEHRNVGNRGHRFGMTGRASFIDQRFGLDYLVPYVFNTRSGFVSSPYGQHRLEPAYELFRVGFSNSFIYQHSQSTTGSISYELTYNSELSGSPETSLPDTVLNFNTGSVTLSGYHNTGSVTRDDEGWLVQPLIEFSSLFGEGTFQYQKASLDIRRYTQVNSSLVIANRLLGGVIFTAEEDSLPSTIRYYSGGTSSVRGWNRQMLGPKVTVLDNDGDFVRYVPIGGHALFSFNMEARQDLNFLIRGVGIAVFLDGGQVWRSHRDLNRRPIQFGTGGGIRYESPIGPVRLDIGYKLNPMDEDIGKYEGEEHRSRWSRFGLHFSIGQAF